MHPFSAHLEPDLRLWSDFKQNPNHIIKIKKFLSVTHVFFTIFGIFFIRKKYGGKWPFPPYFGPKSGQHTPKVRKNRVFKNGIRLSNRAF